MNHRSYRHQHVAVFFALAGCALQSAFAQLVPHSQTRTYSVNGIITIDPLSASESHSGIAPSFADYDQGQGVGVRLGEASVDGFARHISSIAPVLVTASLSADVNVNTNADEETASGGARSDFMFTFDIASLQTWRLTAQGAVVRFGTSQVHLTGGTIQPLDFFFEPFGNADEMIDLGPGQYTLQATASCGGSASGMSSQSASMAGVSFRFEYVVPAPGSLFVLPCGIVLLRRRR